MITSFVFWATLDFLNSPLLGIVLVMCIAANSAGRGELLSANLIVSHLKGSSLGFQRFLLILYFRDKKT